MITTEQWADIPGYEGFYQASNLGRVRSLVRTTIEAHLHGERRAKKILTPCTHGRLQVALFVDNTPKRFQVHRLVLAAWVGECPKGYEGCFRDGDTSNAALDNLYWAPITDRCGGLSEADVRHIRGSGASQQALAGIYGVSQATISNVQTRRTWKHVE